jgi:hypothetical protein
MKKIIFHFLFFLSLPHFACCNPIINDRFNLEFDYSDSVNFVWSLSSPKSPQIDSTELIDSKYPVYFEADKLYKGIPDDINIWYLKIELYQKFVIPPQVCNGKVFEISINNKCIGMDSLKLKISGVDKYGNIVKTESLDINNKAGWKLKSLKTHFDSIQYFTVSLLGTGILLPQDKEKTVPKLYLDKISISIGGRDINQIDEINNPASWRKEILNPDNIYPISAQYSNIIKDIGLDKKKIIAIGETLHGSGSINEIAFLMAKNAIIYNNCKLILMELGLSSSLKLNLFLQGILPESEISNIWEEGRNTHVSNPIFTNFLLWLREYNKTFDRKIFLLGLLDTYEFIESPLYDYIFPFFSNENEDILLPLLNHLHKKELKEASNIVKTNTDRLKHLLGKNGFFFFNHVLENLSEIEAGKKQFDYDTYDYYMWMNANTFISSYLQKNETAFIYAHYGHVKKKEGKHEDLNSLTMGNYLENEYRNDYSVIGITVGSGSITTRELASPEFVTTNLEIMDSGSFEGICMEQKDTCFYYPSNKLLHNIYIIRNIGNRGLYSNNKLYSLLEANADGFIFIRNSNSFNDDYPYNENYLWNKGVKRAAFLKAMQGTN